MYMYSIDMYAHQRARRKQSLYLYIYVCVYMYMCIYIYIYIYVYIYIYIYICIHILIINNKPWTLPFGRTQYVPWERRASMGRSEILDFGGLVSSRVLTSRGGTLRSMGNFPETLSQRILAGIILVGRLGVLGGNRMWRWKRRAPTGRFNWQPFLPPGTWHLHPKHKHKHKHDNTNNNNKHTNKHNIHTNNDNNACHASCQGYLRDFRQLPIC